MPKVVKKQDQTPKNLKPFIFHGVDLDYTEGAKQAIAECPFCRREKKFSVEIDTGKWKCFVCGESGNPVVFIRKLWEAAELGTDEEIADMLASRTLVEPTTLSAWRARVSPTTGDWVMAGIDATGKFKQLYKYVQVGQKMRLIPTPETGGHGLHACDETAEFETVYVCEGPWDAMAFWEVMRTAKYDEAGTLVSTSNFRSSLLGAAIVVAVPGCGSVGEPFRRWLPLFAGKRVVLCFNSDHPHEANGKTAEPAGLAATRRAVGLLATAEQPPSSVEWICWGPDGYDPDRKSGYDIRDHLSQGETVKDRVPFLQEVLALVQPIPEDWVVGRSASAVRNGSVKIEPAHCERWVDLTTAWRKAMKWTEGLDRTLSCMLASSASTMVPGDQTWFIVLGPASCGKSTLCEAMNVSERHVFSNSTMTDLHSGWKTDNDGKEDHSMAAKIKKKTFIVKDGDTILQNPAKDKLLAQMRDAYDRVTRVHYGNGICRVYDDMDVTVLFCGTSSLRALDTSELGERFLKCTVMDEIDDDLEDEILWRKANQVERNIGMQSDSNNKSANDPDLVLAMQLTGGYVDYLRDNASELLSQVSMPDEAKKSCIYYGKFISYMRARPSVKQAEAAERELAARLVTQLTRLAFCMGIVLNKKEVEVEVLRRVKTVALDTAKGVTLDMVREMRKYGQEGVVFKPICLHSHTNENRCRELLRFLKRIGVVDVTTEKVAGVSTQPRWRLTDKFERLYDLVMGEG